MCKYCDDVVAYLAGPSEGKVNKEFAVKLDYPYLQDADVVTLCGEFVGDVHDSTSVIRCAYITVSSEADDYECHIDRISYCPICGQLLLPKALPLYE